MTFGTGRLDRCCFPLRRFFLQPKFEAVLSEVEITNNELHYALTHLSSWMKPDYVSKNLVGPPFGFHFFLLLVRVS